MKLYKFEFNAQRSIGAEWEGQIIDLPAAFRALQSSQGPKSGQLRAIPSEMLSFIRLGTLALEAAEATIAFMRKRPAVPVGEQLLYPFDAVRILAPLARPGKILCCAHHALTFFPKLSSTVIGPGDPIIKPSSIERLEAAGGLGAIIGKRMKNVPENEVASHIFGYALLLDISASDRRLGENQLMLGKNFDTFCPLGPCIVTADEFSPSNAAQMLISINETELQSPSHPEPLIQPSTAISYLSGMMSLEPGDIVVTGSTGAPGRESPRVNPSVGDRLAVQLEGIGRLENHVIAEPGK